MGAIVSLIDSGTLAAITALFSPGIAAGYLLGGPKPENSDRARADHCFQPFRGSVNTANASSPERSRSLPQYFFI
jgi:hypothetical protein